MNFSGLFAQKNRVFLFYPVLLVVGIFLWHGMTGFSLRDEGYLWYGAKALLAGDFSLREYSGYDPGRYFLVAGTMMLLGDSGVISMRLAPILCQLGASVVLMRWIVRAGMIRSVRDELIAIGLLCALCLWMFPRHKIFDTSTSILLVVLFTWFLSTVSVRRSLYVGVGIGLITIMGRNNGDYGLLTMALLLPAFSRADPAHLAQSMAPFRIPVFCLRHGLTQRLRFGVMLGVVAVSAVAIALLRPGLQCAVYMKCQTEIIAGSPVVMTKDIAAEVALFQRVHATLNDNGDGGLIVPFWPGAYAVLDTRALVWEMYPTSTRKLDFERNELARIQAGRIPYAIESDSPMDGNDALRFPKTHPLTSANMLSAYEDFPPIVHRPSAF